MGHDFPTRNLLSSQATAGLSEVGMKYFPTWPTKSLAGFAQKKKKRVWTQDTTVLLLNQRQQRQVRGQGKGEVKEEPPSGKKNTSSIGVGERGLGQNSEVLSLLETRILQLQAGRMGEKL